MSKDVEWKLRQERGVLYVEAEGCAVEVEEEEHDRRLEIQPSVGSGRCRGSLEAAGVLYTGTRFFQLMKKDVKWKLIQERGVFGVEAYRRKVEVRKEEHEETGISAIGGIWSLPPQRKSRRCAVHWNAMIFCSCRKMWNGS